MISRMRGSVQAHTPTACECVTGTRVGRVFQALTDARSNSPLTALMRLCTGAARRRKKVKTERRAQPKTEPKRTQGGHSSGGGVNGRYAMPHASAACRGGRCLCDSGLHFFPLTTHEPDIEHGKDDPEAGGRAKQGGPQASEKARAARPREQVRCWRLPPSPGARLPDTQEKCHASLGAGAQHAHQVRV